MPGADKQTELQRFKDLSQKLAQVPKREVEAKRAESKKRKPRAVR